MQDSNKTRPDKAEPMNREKLAQIKSMDQEKREKMVSQKPVKK